MGEVPDRQLRIMGKHCKHPPVQRGNVECLDVPVKILVDRVAGVSEEISVAQG